MSSRDVRIVCPRPNLQPVLGYSDVTEFTTNSLSPLRQMLWLEDVCAQHSKCRTCTSPRKHKPNPTNQSGATLTWMLVGEGLHIHSLTRVIPYIFSSTQVMFVDL